MSAQNPGGRFDLAALFAPRSIALIGATDKSPWSLNTLDNIRASGFDGRVYLVNPHTAVVHGENTYPDVASLPETVDLIFVMVPTDAVLPTLRAAVERGTRAAVVLTAGFGEVGAEGKKRERELAQFAYDNGVALLGPNGNGYINAAAKTTPYGLRLPGPLIDGGVGFILQSGALASSVLAMALARNVGLSFLTAMGNEAVVSVTDVIDYLIDDERTKVIALFLESVRDPAEFRRIALRALAVGKPIVALKVGRSSLGAQAALAHTGALVGDNAVNTIAFEQMGVTRVTSLEELIITSGLFASVGSLPGPRAGVVTPSGGASEIIADRAEDEGLVLPTYSLATVASLTEILPDFATVQNPLDVTGYVVIDPSLPRRSVAIVAEDPGVDFILLNMDLPRIEGPNHETTLSFYKETVRVLDAITMPAVITSSVLTDPTDYGRRILAESDFPYILGGLDRAVQAIGHVVRWSQRRQDAEHDVVQQSLAPIALPADARGMWTEYRAAQFLAQHGVTVVPSRLAGSAAEAVAHAEALGYPVVVKAVADDLGHKSEIGGVRLNLHSPEEVAAAHDGIIAALTQRGLTSANTVVQPQRSSDGVEMLVGVVRDPAWGLTLAVGLGGIWVEVLKDAALTLLPTTQRSITQALRSLRGFALLDGARGQAPVDVDALAAEISVIASVAFRLGDRLAALEINPLRVQGSNVEALDALITWTDDHATREEQS